jgi:hypothetical protein
MIHLVRLDTMHDNVGFWRDQEVEHRSQWPTRLKALSYHDPLLALMSNFAESWISIDCSADSVRVNAFFRPICRPSPVRRRRKGANSFTERAVQLMAPHAWSRLGWIRSLISVVAGEGFERYLTAPIVIPLIPVRHAIAITHARGASAPRSLGMRL